MNNYIFKVADCSFSVLLPVELNVTGLLPSFRPFLTKGEQPSDLLFQLVVDDKPLSTINGDSKLLEESFNDLGHVRVMDAGENLQIEVSYDDLRGHSHMLNVNHEFTEGRAFIRCEDTTARVALSSMLRMLFAQAIIRKNGISVHASCVVRHDKGYLFLGKSGTGKSTHAEQWMKIFPDCRLLNDDNPVIRLKDNEVYVYGSPWSGKKDCYKQERVPIGGIVRLNQSATNEFIRLEDVQAFGALLPSCSVLRGDNIAQNLLYDLLIQIVGRVAVGRLNCLPITSAAKLCYQSLMNQ